MQKWIGIGNLTRNPESKQVGEHTVTTFTIAVTRTYKRDETDFINIVAWRKLADLCAQYLAKGSKVAVCGEIRTRSYDAKDGSKRYVTEIQANSVEFLSGKSEAAQEPLPDFNSMEDEPLPF